MPRLTVYPDDGAADGQVLADDDTTPMPAVPSGRPPAETSAPGSSSPSGQVPPPGQAPSRAQDAQDEPADSSRARGPFEAHHTPAAESGTDAEPVPVTQSSDGVQVPEVRKSGPGAAKLDQIKDLYLTAEAIGEDALSRHFQQVSERQRQLIKEYFDRS